MVVFSVAESSGSPGVEVAGLTVKVGTLVGGVFVERPNRTVNAGEKVAVKVVVEVRGDAGTRYEGSLKLSVANPLGVVVGEDSRNWSSTLRGAGEEWEFTFVYEFPPSALRGYYNVDVSVKVLNSVSRGRVSFFYRGLVDRRNVVNVTYVLVLEGTGEVGELRVALPQADSMTFAAGPVVSPRPSRVEKDELGNVYAVYEKVAEGAFRKEFKVSFVGVQEVSLVSADAPIDSLRSLPPGLEEFLRPSPYIESDSPEIVEVARRLSSGVSTVRQLASRIADYVSSTLRYNDALGSIRDSWSLGALWALHAKQGMCLQFARLYVAIARAAGLPARVVEGLVVTPPGGSSSYLHAYAEFYLPGYGWVPVEPQLPGRYVGLVPPVPGYVPLVKGLGEERAGSRDSYVASFTLTYRGSVSTRFTYSYRLYPYEGLSGSVKLSVKYPRELLYGDPIKVNVSVEPRDAVSEVAVTAPNGSRYEYRLVGPGSVVLAASDAGNWTVEVFSMRQGYLPAYTVAVVPVRPRPIKLSVEVGGLPLLGRPAFIVRVSPPVPGITVAVNSSNCLYYEARTLETNSSGVAVYEPPVLLCPATIEFRARGRGYTEAVEVYQYDYSRLAPLYALILLVAVLLVAVRAIRKKH